jgi:hypothetical protein
MKSTKKDKILDFHIIKELEKLKQKEKFERIGIPLQEYNYENDIEKSKEDKKEQKTGVIVIDL